MRRSCTQSSGACGCDSPAGFSSSPAVHMIGPWHVHTTNLLPTSIWGRCLKRTCSSLAEWLSAPSQNHRAHGSIQEAVALGAPLQGYAERRKEMLLGDLSGEGGRSFIPEPDCPPCSLNLQKLQPALWTSGWPSTSIPCSALNPSGSFFPPRTSSPCCRSLKGIC